MYTMTSTRDDECELERFWPIESIGIESRTNGNHYSTFLHDYINSSIARTPDVTYKATFPWKEEHPPLPFNYTVCEKRTCSMVRRLSKTPHLLKAHGDIVADQEKQGFIAVDEANLPNSAHYISHHPVKKESSTIPIRIVYDSSCRQSPEKPCLNDCLS